MHNKNPKPGNISKMTEIVLIVRNSGVNCGAKCTNLTPQLVNELLFLKRK